jgi:CMP-N-acetylneuraminic acid synthetase
VESNAGTFENAPLVQWHDKIELLKASSHLMNSDSIQAAIEEYVSAYGDVESMFAADMFTADSYLGLLLHESENKPNAKQLGLA